MRTTARISEASTLPIARNCLLRFVDLLVKMWLRRERRHLKPLAVALKRFAAPRFVFNLGITSLSTGHYFCKIY
jgi:hypothetical protein